ncbi:MAG: histidine kinase [Niabella sp.]
MYFACLQKSYCRFIKAFHIIVLYFFSGILFNACNADSQPQELVKDRDIIPLKDSLLLLKLKEDATKANIEGDTVKVKQLVNQSISLAKEKRYNFSLFKTYFFFAIVQYNRREYDYGDIFMDSAIAFANKINTRQFLAMGRLAAANKPKNVFSDSSLMYYELIIPDTGYLNDEYKSQMFYSLSRSYEAKLYNKEAKYYLLRSIDMLRRDPNKTIINNKNLALSYQALYILEMNLRDTVAAYEAIKKAYQITIDSLKEKSSSIIYQSLADYYYDIRKYDSALYYYQVYDKKVKQDYDKGMQTAPYILQAKVYIQLKEYEKAKRLIEKVKSQGQPTKNELGYLYKEYHKVIYALAKQHGDNAAALKSFEIVAHLDSITNAQEQKEQLTYLEEKITKARAEKTIAEKEQKINNQKNYTIGFAIAATLITILGLLLFLNQRRKKIIETQKLKELEQESIIEKNRLSMQAEKEERQRISQEIHDDIGPTLTSINMAANMIKASSGTEHNNPAIDILSKNASSLNNQMREIIWSLNAANDSVYSLTAFIRKFATTFLTAADIKPNFKSTIENPSYIIEGYKRRSIYQTTKEILNNVVKHSEATAADILIKQHSHEISISIRDNGIGLPEDGKINYGNGLKNIENNIKKLSGSVIWDSSPKGFSLTISVPLPNDITSTALNI